MFIPKFALRQREIEILSKYFTRPVNIQLKEKLTAYVIDEKSFEEILSFIEDFRDGIEVNESINEAGTPSAIPNSNRAGIIRAVTTIFNLIVDIQNIKTPEIKTAALASALAATMGVFTISPEYGHRLLSIIKSKM